MNIRVFSFPVFSFQLNLNNTDGVATIRITPITIISIDKIINTFIIFKLYHKFLGTGQQNAQELGFSLSGLAKTCGNL